MLVLRLGHQGEPPAGIERRVLDGARPEGDARDRHDAQPRVLPAHRLAGRRVPQVEAALAALEPEPQPLGAQNSSSFRAASATRSADGMYASSICQYGYGTS